MASKVTKSRSVCPSADPTRASSAAMSARTDRVGRIPASERSDSRPFRRVFDRESGFRYLGPERVGVLPSPLCPGLLACRDQLRHECRHVLDGRLPFGKTEPENLVGAE